MSREDLLDIMSDAVENVRERPAVNRGPYVISDEALQRWKGETMKPRSGWKIWFPDVEDDTDAALWESDFTTAAEVVRDVYYWHHFATSDSSSLEVAVISPEGDTTFWDVYEVCTVKVQQVEGKT